MSADELVFRRVFRAPRDLVWRCLTEPAELTQFWGPRGMTTPLDGIVVELRARRPVRDPDGRRRGQLTDGRHLPVTLTRPPGARSTIPPARATLAQGAARLGERVLEAARNFGVDGAAHEPVPCRARRCHRHRLRPPGTRLQPAHRVAMAGPAGNRAEHYLGQRDLRGTPPLPGQPELCEQPDRRRRAAGAPPIGRQLRTARHRQAPLRSGQHFPAQPQHRPSARGTGTRCGQPAKVQ